MVKALTTCFPIFWSRFQRDYWPGLEGWGAAAHTDFWDKERFRKQEEPEAPGSSLVFGEIARSSEWQDPVSKQTGGRLTDTWCTHYPQDHLKGEETKMERALMTCPSLSNMEQTFFSESCVFLKRPLSSRRLHVFTCSVYCFKLCAVRSSTPSSVALYLALSSNDCFLKKTLMNHSNNILIYILWSAGLVRNFYFRENILAYIYLTISCFHKCTL